MEEIDNNETFDYARFLRDLTQKPGVYQMIDKHECCIYVGKAKNLKKRVSSYFKAEISASDSLSSSADATPPRYNKDDKDIKKMMMVSHIRRIDTIITHTEGEALLLENQLIKQLKPRYNICLRDDKSYPHIYLSSHQKFPRLTLLRGSKKSKGKYFGPYPSAGAVRESLQILQKIFPVRQCDDSFYKNRSRPCLQHQIKRCSAPCVGMVTEEEYAEDVAHTVLFLEGKNASLIDGLVVKMETASAALSFEKAAQYRDQIAHLRKLMERQYVSGDEGDIDVVACEISGGVACVQVFFIRNGQHLGNRSFFPKIPAGKDNSDVLSAFLLQFYLSKKLPKDILMSHFLKEQSLVQEVLSNKAERKIKLVVKPRGERARWLDMAKNNAAIALKQKILGQENTRERLHKLSVTLGLEVDIQRMECFDISHTQGDQTVASCVVLGMEGPIKDDYRRFNIKGVTAGDDYAALAQAVSRRFVRTMKGEQGLPDVLVIDGGKGQVVSVSKALMEIGCMSVFVIGISKGSDRKVGMEKIYRADDGQTLIIAADDPGLLVLQQIRDEAHRFAISGHRQQRGKIKKQSTLESIKGLGPKKRQRLLKQFGGLREIKSAGVEDLCTVEGINASLGQRIYDCFHEGGSL